MSRTAGEVLTHHIQAMMTMDFENAPSDYSKELAAITRLDGRNRTMGYDTMEQIMQKAIRITGKLHLRKESMEKMSKKLHTVFQCAVSDYAVFLAEMKPYSSFACFNYIVRDGKAVYVTGFAKAPFFMPSIGIDAHPFAPGKETMAVMDAHLTHMRKKDTAAMLADYADDAIVITNLSETPFIGKQQLRTYCEAQAERASVQFGAVTAPDTRYILKDAVAELGCIGFQQKKTKQYGVLTQRVQDGRIVFESAVFKDAGVIL